MIDRPPEQVFAFFTDPVNDLKWRSHVKEASAQGPIGVGNKSIRWLRGPAAAAFPPILR
jgi:uncharacterized protein YndB with AHSA1/START domain